MVLIPYFFLSAAFLIIESALFPGLALTPFAPFLCLTMLRVSRLPALYIAALSGLVIDLLFSAHPMGYYSLVYTAIVLITHPFKRKFLESNLLSLPLFTFCISLILCAFSPKPLYLPLFNTLFTILFYTIPLYRKSFLSTYLVKNHSQFM